MAVDAILRGLLADRTVPEGGRTVLDRLIKAGFTAEPAGAGLSLTGWERKNNLFQPGLGEAEGEPVKDAVEVKSAHFYVSDSVRYDVRYQDAAVVLKALRCSRRTMDHAKWMAWFDLWRQEAFRLNSGYPECGFSLREPTCRDLGVEEEVKGLGTDEEIIAVVRRFLTEESLGTYLRLYPR